MALSRKSPHRSGLGFWLIPPEDREQGKTRDSKSRGRDDEAKEKSLAQLAVLGQKVTLIQTLTRLFVKSPVATEQNLS